MTRWRLFLMAAALLLVGVPWALPFVELVWPGTDSSSGWRVWAEGERLLGLARATLLLAGGTLALALPVGVGLAVLLYRTDLPARRVWRFFTLLGLFIPLPLIAAAWQPLLGTTSWFAGAVRGSGAVRPWAEGLPAAVWVHALAGLPWVVLLVGLGLSWVERELEEDALTAAGPVRVLWAVSLPRSGAALGAAALWVVLLATTEITVTDAMQVRTFAEEVYTQLIVGDPSGQARAVAASVPAVLLTGLLVLTAVRHWERNLPPPEGRLAPPLRLPLGRWRIPALALATLAVGLILGVPLVSLAWKVGVAGTPPAWSLATAGSHLAKAVRVETGLILESLAQAAAAGLLTSLLALLLCWAALESWRLRAAALALATAVWATPGPTLGFGLKSAIRHILEVAGYDGFLADALYYGPSPVPVVWAYGVRFFPFAMALLWPVVRLIPAELRDAARVDGATPAAELRHLILPLTFPAALRAGLAVLVLSLGELSASKILETPGSQTFAHEVFMQMHYGVSNNLAALGLVQLALVLVGASVWVLLERPRHAP